MAVPSSAGQGPPRSAGRSIGSYFTARLAVPAVCLVLVWAAVAGAVFAGALHHVVHPSAHRALIEAMVVAGSGLLVALAVIALIWTARPPAGQGGRQPRGDGPLPRRRAAAEGRGPAARRRRASGGRGAAGRPVPVRPARIAEFAAVTAALASMQGTATTAAAAEARLRGGFRQVLTSLGRRNQSLLLRQLRIIDTLEQQAASPAALADLFALDHLTTRMRRHAESLTVLSGAPAARPRIGQVAVIDVIRAAVAETEDYKRVVVRTETEEVVAASAVNDMIHLLAELIENATLFSPSATKVEVRAERVANGFAIEVEDRGLGIAARPAERPERAAGKPARLRHRGRRPARALRRGPAGRRHGVEVSLTPSPYRGTKAIVLLPDDLVLPGADADGPAGAAQAALDERALPGRRGRVTRAAGAKAEREGDAAGQPATTFHGLPRRVRPDKQAQPAEQDRPAGPAREAGAHGRARARRRAAARRVPAAQLAQKPGR